MKTNRYIFALILLMISTVAFSQVPRMLNHQGYLTNSSGVALDTTMAMTFRLFPDSAGGSSVWEQTMDTVTFTKGVFSVNLGPIDALFDQQYWLEVEAGGEVINPRTRLTSAPYAIRSAVANNVSQSANLDVNSIQTTGMAKFKDFLEMEGPDGYFRAQGNWGKYNGTTVLGGLYGKNGSGAQMRFSGITEDFLDIGQNDLGNFVVESNDNNIMTVTTAGRVGIGTSLPASPLHIYGYADPLVKVESPAGGQSVLQFGTGGTAKWGWYIPGGGSNLSLWHYLSPYQNYITFNGSSGDIYLAPNSGYVGIGTTSPSYPLHVYSTGYANAWFDNRSTSGSAYGLFAYASGSGGSSHYGLYAYASGASTNYAGYFYGNVQVSGTLSKWAGSFKIDHPLDPANKYLSHSFVESPDMMNIYNGIVTMDANGEATVQLPAWFDALNKDFRYQLTAIGAPGPNLYIAKKVANNSFTVAGGKPGMEVSWQVTGIRKDVYAEKHRIPVEENKVGEERGLYMMPELFGQPKEKGIEYIHEKRARAVDKKDVE